MIIWKNVTKRLHKFVKVIKDWKRSCLADLTLLRLSRFISIKDGSFWGCSQMVLGTKKASFSKIWHTSYNGETCHNYGLPKEDQKILQITWHNSWVLLKSAFLHWKFAQEIYVSKHLNGIALRTLHILLLPGSFISIFELIILHLQTLIKQQTRETMIMIYDVT